MVKTKGTLLPDGGMKPGLYNPVALLVASQRPSLKEDAKDAGWLASSNRWMKFRRACNSVANRPIPFCPIHLESKAMCECSISAPEILRGFQAHAELVEVEEQRQHRQQPEGVEDDLIE